MVRRFSSSLFSLFTVFFVFGGACTVAGTAKDQNDSGDAEGGDGGDGPKSTDDPGDSEEGDGDHSNLAAGDGDASGGSGTSSSGGADGSGGDANGSGGDAPLHVTIQLGQQRQEIAGFGISDSELTEDEADQLFGQEDGELGLSILRIAMDSNGEPTHDDLTWRAVEQANTRGVRTFIATVTSPPGVCKSNADVNNGGHLIEECFELWSNGIAAFPTLVKNETGVDLLAISPQNEPDFASCGDAEPCDGTYPSAVFTSGDYVAFLKVLAPKLSALDPPVQLMGGEPSQWNRLWSDESATGSEPSDLDSVDPFNCGIPLTNCDPEDPDDGYDYGHALAHDAEAWSAVDMLATHQYASQKATTWPTDIDDKKPVWMTEMSGRKWWPEQGPSDHIENGIAVAEWIHDALTVGEASAWLWKEYRSYLEDNAGLVLADETPTKRKWTLGNYSKFVRPGFKRVSVQGNAPPGLLISAFKDSQGSLTVVVINNSSTDLLLPFSIAGGTPPSALVPYVTSHEDDLAAKTQVLVADGSFEATFSAMSVTSLTGRN